MISRRRQAAGHSRSPKHSDGKVILTQISPDKPPKPVGGMRLPAAVCKVDLTQTVINEGSDENEEVKVSDEKPCKDTSRIVDLSSPI